MGYICKTMGFIQEDYGIYRGETIGFIGKDYRFYNGIYLANIMGYIYKIMR